MDLLEINHQHPIRHPWEIARLLALEKILAGVLGSKQGFKILDVGCGDGFVSRKLFHQIQQVSVSCLDISFTPEQIHQLRTLCPRFVYKDSYESLQGEKFDLILMLDVIEHSKDDWTLLQLIIENFLIPEGKILILAPAFQFLFGAHDRFLKHFRRYTRKNLVTLSETAGLKVLASGYLFLLLLLPRVVSVLLQTILGSSNIKARGIGNWQRNRMITFLYTFLLCIDNKALLWFRKYRVTIPGLSTWILCQK